MARPLRIQYPGAYYHITSRGNERKDIYKSQRDREKFLDYLQSATQRYGAVIHCYCLMSNHYHLLMETPEGNLSQVMQHNNGSYTTYYNVKRKRSGHLFQGRYHAVLVEANTYALELSRYIHLNPVRAGIAKLPEEHPWSSHSYYINGQATPEWLHTETILAYLSSKESQSRRSYQSFVQDKLGCDYPSPLRAAAAGAILGLDAFIDRVRRKYLTNDHRDRNLPAHRALTRRRTVRQITDAVDSLFEDQNMARKISIHLCHRYSGEGLRSLGDHIGLSESGITQTSRRLGEKATGDEGLEGRLAEVIKKLGLCNV